MRWIRSVKIAMAAASLGLVVSTGVADERDDVAVNMTGNWRVVQYSYNNRVIPPGNMTIYISGNKMTFLGPNNAGAVSIALDVSKSPTWFDLIDNSDRGHHVYRGICELNGDRLKLAYSFTGHERPTRFGGDRMILMELVREGSLTTQPTTSTTAATTKP
jgi:uncharacterized protein (TIGR03067 family)